ncbi:MAG: hypothetical protein E7294_04460 [Lachnospiraceae bacterium]|jgi:DUF1680 family protein|nr:hypothetical protein [Lachnospiraceae bacterium]
MKAKQVMCVLLAAAMLFTAETPSSLAVSATAATVSRGAAVKQIQRETEGGGAVNLALTATATAGHTNVWGIKESSINDGALADANAATSWNCWDAKETDYPMPVTLTWDEAQTVSSMRVMWWADGGGVAFPKKATLSYLDGEEWKEIGEVGVEHGDVNGANGVWNNLTFDAVTTTALRLSVERDATGSTGLGISEWEVYHVEDAVALLKDAAAGLTLPQKASADFDLPSKANGVDVTWQSGNAAIKIEDGKAVVTRQDADTSVELTATFTFMGETVTKSYNVTVEKKTGDEPEKPVNLALAATASAAYTNIYGVKTTCINDGKLAGGDSSTSWNCWNAPASDYPMPVTLTWDEPQTVSSMRVMWWAYNDGGVVFPKKATLSYLDGEDWKEIGEVGVSHGGVDGADGVWNILNFDEVTTTALRLTIERDASGATGVGISEWEVYNAPLTEELTGASITGGGKLAPGSTMELTGVVTPASLTEAASCEWSVTNGADIVEIDGAADQTSATIKALKEGTATIQFKVSANGVTKTATVNITVTDEKADAIETYVTTTAEGVKPILPDSVVAKGIQFDEPTTSTGGKYDFAESFNDRLIPVTWESVDPSAYAKAGSTFTVKGTASYNGTDYEAKAQITVKAPVKEGSSNSSVTFENVQFENSFWNKRQVTNAMTSLNVAIQKIEAASGGEPNFDNAIKKLNGQPYNAFSGYVFQDSDIYKSIEAISYTLSATQNDQDPEVVKKREELQAKLDSWIEKIEKVQYADGYIDTLFTLRSQTFSGGGKPGTHRWWELSNHEMYNAGHFLEGVVAYTRYREGIGSPDYRLYVAGHRFADEIVSLFGPDGTRHEVPGHEEIELALVKFGKLAEEYEGEGAGQKYYDTAKLLIDRRGENSSQRESGYHGGEYSQDATPFKEETNAVGHAVRANYFYTGVTDVATMLPEGDEDRDAYIKSLDTIWDSVTQKKTYITGGIGSATATSSSEGFGADYDLPPDQSYIEICAAIAAANWNQRMNLLHEDGKYADMVEKNLYNSILVGENLDGNLFYYSSLLRVNGGNPRSAWFACACCPPNLMRTIAAASGYMYSVHNKDVFVNMYSGSTGHLTVGGEEINIKQETEYPWNGAVKLTLNIPSGGSDFALKLRIPGWVKEQKNQNVAITRNGKAVSVSEEKGYVTLEGKWEDGDEIMIDIPMEIRMTESNENVKSTKGMIALQRGPIVYCMEKAGNAQLNENIENFDPLNFVIPRDAKLTAEYNEDLLNGVVEITGDVKYATGNGMEMVDAKLQAIPYYAWNNRGDDAEYVPGQAKNSSSKMLIWTTADQPEYKEVGLTSLAKPSVNYNYTGQDASKFADGNDGTFWNGWGDSNLQTSDQWMMYDFGDKKVTLSGTSIWFYDDNGGVMLPKGVKVEYEDAQGSWKEVTPAGEWTLTANQFSELKFEEITTSKIRVTMDHKVGGSGKVAVAVIEWTLDGHLEGAGDVSGLRTAIREALAEDYKKSDYTEESWAKYTEALQKAETASSDLSLSQEQFDAAKAALEEAVKGLVKAETKPDQPDKPDQPSVDPKPNPQPSNPTVTTQKHAQTMTVKTAVKKVKLSKLKKKKQTVSAITVKGAQGMVSYTKVKKGSSNKLSINKKTGKITVKKGTKKGTYKIRVTVKAAGNANFLPAEKTVTVKVKVK